MKYSIIFFSSWAGLVAAAPVGEQQAVVKLPFVEEAQAKAGGIDCGPRGYSDETCGTEKYCQVFDESPSPSPWQLKESYANSEACFEAHEPREPSKQPSKPSQTPPTQAAATPVGEQQAVVKLPFIEKAPDGGLHCGPFGFSDDNCGTEKYCQAFDFSPRPPPALIQGPYANSKECFDAHEPREPSKQPKTSQTPPTQAAATPVGEQQAVVKLPFIEKAKVFNGGIDCGPRGLSDENCGTVEYCQVFDESPRPPAWQLKESYANSKECFEAHEPREPSKQSKDKDASEKGAAAPLSEQQANKAKRN